MYQNCLRKSSSTLSSLNHKETVFTLLFSSGTKIMGLTKLVVSCVLLIILSEVFLGSGRLSKIDFGYIFLIRK